MTNNLQRKAHTTDWIPVKNLSVLWAQSQRDLNEKWVDKIIDEFDPDMFDDLVVTLPNGKGVYHIVDGQHRRAVIQKLFGDDESVPCRIIDAKDPARAAAVFDQINTSRRQPSSVERFLVRVTAGHPAEVAINKIVTGLGYKIAPYTSDHTIRGVRALMRLYNNYGGEVIKDTLMTIKATWVDDVHALDAAIVEGYGILIGEHHKNITWQRLREQVSRKLSPGKLLGKAKYHKEMAGEPSVAKAVAHVLKQTYNQGLRKGKLD